METFHNNTKATFNLEDCSGNGLIAMSRTMPDETTDLIAIITTDSEERETVIMLTLEEAQNMANALGYLLL